MEVMGLYWAPVELDLLEPQILELPNIGAKECHQGAKLAHIFGSFNIVLDHQEFIGFGLWFNH